MASIAPAICSVHAAALAFDASAGPPAPLPSRGGVALIASLVLHGLLLLTLPDWRGALPDDLPPLQVTLLSAPPPAPAAAPVQDRELEPAPASIPRPPEPARPAVDRVAKVRPLVRPAPARAPAAVDRPAPAETAPVAPTSPASDTLDAEDARLETQTAVAPSTPQPVPLAPPPAPGPDPAALARYGQALSQHFAREQGYPRLAAMRGWEGEVTLMLTIARKGGLLSVRISRSSGHEILDRHALALVQEGGPLPTPPAAAGDEPLEITVPVRFSLRAG